MNNPIKWISDEIHKLLAWVTQAEKKLAPAISIAETVLNALKSFDNSIIGQTVESIIEAAIPASTGLIEAFKIQLPIWLIDLNLIKNDGNKTLTEQWEDILTYLNSISDPDVKASQYNTLKALFLKFFGTNSGEVVSIQQALMLAQPTHGDNILV
jgi:hypothetical protein